MALTPFRQTFDRAAVENEQGVMVFHAGRDGLDFLFTAEHADHAVTLKMIEDVFAENQWTDPHSFTWDDFQLLVVRLFNIPSETVAGASAEAALSHTATDASAATVATSGHVSGTQVLTKNKPTFNGSTMTLGLQPEDAVPRIIRDQLPQYVRPVTTCGDGACALHAVFGQPDAGGTLFAPEARTYAKHCMNSVLNSPHMEGDMAIWVRAVSLSLWDEFIVPHLEGLPSREGEIFWDELSIRNPLFAEKCEAVHAMNKMQGNSMIDARKRLLLASSAFFTREMEEEFVRPLAVQLRYIPEHVNPSDVSADEMELLRVHSPHASEFLGSAKSTDGFVCGTRSVFPASGPQCKYAALFDPSRHFDAIRYMFLVAADPSMMTFVQSLHEIIRTTSAHPDLIERARCFCSQVHSFSLSNVTSQLPASFVSEAWSAYCNSICHPDYYFSIDELLIICRVAAVNMAVFTRNAQHLSFAGGTFEGTGLSVSEHVFLAFCVCVSEHAFAFRCVCVFGTRVPGMGGWWLGWVVGGSQNVYGGGGCVVGGVGWLVRGGAFSIVPNRLRRQLVAA